MRGLIAVSLALFVMIAVNYDDGESYCVVFPQNGRDIFGVAQRTIVVYGDNEVSLIPQVNFEGNASDFGIIVPVPNEPELTTVGANIFTEASFMTQPLVRQGSGGCACEEESDLIFGPFRMDVAVPGAQVEDSKSGVTVVYEEIVGMYQAVVLQATDVSALTHWLSDNDYAFDPDDENILADYVADNWYFVAMKLDPAQAPNQIDQWWTATTSPARITFEHTAESLPYPLKISSISTQDKAEVLIYTIGADPMRFAGARVEYVNEINRREMDAIAEQYPALFSFISEGLFVTKLRKTFLKSEMHDDIEIIKSDDRSEFREVRYANNAATGFAGIVLLALALLMKKRKSES